MKFYGVLWIIILQLYKLTIVEIYPNGKIEAAPPTDAKSQLAAEPQQPHQHSRQRQSLEEMRALLNETARLENNSSTMN